MIYENITQAIGNTPIVKLQTHSIKCSNINIKQESINPGDSVKDCMVEAIIEDAESEVGVYKPGDTIVDGTTGNTGNAQAKVCSAKGYPFCVHNGRNVFD